MIFSTHSKEDWENHPLTRDRALFIKWDNNDFEGMLGAFLVDKSIVGNGKLQKPLDRSESKTSV